MEGALNFRFSFNNLFSVKMSASFCIHCGDQMPCDKHRRPGKPTARSRQFAQQRALARRNSGILPMPSVPVPERTDVTIHGPNLKPKNFPNSFVSETEEEGFTAPLAGRFFSIPLREFLTHRLSGSMTVYSVIFRACLDFSEGVLGIVKDYSSTDPKPPSTLSRRRFKKGVAFGIQILFPSNMKVQDIPEAWHLVIYYANEFPANTVVWQRKAYFIHAPIPRAKIPEDILMTEQLDTA